MKINYFTCLLMLALVSAPPMAFANKGQDLMNSKTETTTTPPVPISQLPNNAFVGGSEMFPNKNIIENASKSADHTTLVTALTAAGLDKTLSGNGPFTVFAPNNGAFGKLPPGQLDAFLKPENKSKLAMLLTYHVVAGKYMSADLDAKAATNGGKVSLPTLEGEQITLIKDAGGQWSIEDAKGGKALITIPDITQSNGVIFVIDSVLMPAR